MNSKLACGLVGVGAISKFYLAALEKLETPVLAAVCDLNSAKLDAFRQRQLPSYTDYREMLNQPDLEAVIINVPNDLHFQICKAALLAGKHVCCEKPLTTDPVQAEELMELSQKTGKTLFTAFHRRYNLNFQQVLDRLSEPGAIAAVKANYLEKIEEHVGDDRWYLQPDRCGGGCIADNGPNVYDTLSYFLGHLEVLSARVNRNKNGIELQAQVELVSANKVPVKVNLDWDYSFGEKKDLTISFKDGQVLYIDMLHGFPAFKSSLFHEYEAILADFATQVSTGGCHGEDGLDAAWLVAETYRVALPMLAEQGQGVR